MVQDVKTRLGEVAAEVLAKHGVGIAAYVADHLLSTMTDEIGRRDDMRLVTSAREDEGVAMIAGAYLGGMRGAMLMQSSGFGLCSNALASFVLPYQIPVPMIVGLRGDLGEFNVAQIAGGQAVGPTCRALGVPYEVPSSLAEFELVLDGMLDTCFATQRAVCIGVRRSLVA